MGQLLDVAPFKDYFQSFTYDTPPTGCIVHALQHWEPSSMLPIIMHTCILYTVIVPFLMMHLLRLMLLPQQGAFVTSQIRCTIHIYVCVCVCVFSLNNKKMMGQPYFFFYENRSPPFTKFEHFLQIGILPLTFKDKIRLENPINCYLIGLWVPVGRSHSSSYKGVPLVRIFVTNMYRILPMMLLKRYLPIISLHSSSLHTDT